MSLKGPLTQNHTVTAVEANLSYFLFLRTGLTYWTAKAGLQFAILLPHPPGVTGSPSHPVRKLGLETSQECYYIPPHGEKRRNRKPRLSSRLSLTPFSSSRIFLLPPNRFLGTSHHYLIFLSSLRQTEVAKQSPGPLWLGTWGGLVMRCFQTVKGGRTDCFMCSLLTMICCKWCYFLSPEKYEGYNLLEGRGDVLLFKSLGIIVHNGWRIIDAQWIC